MIQKLVFCLPSSKLVLGGNAGEDKYSNVLDRATMLLSRKMSPLTGNKRNKVALILGSTMIQKLAFCLPCSLVAMLGRMNTAVN